MMTPQYFTYSPCRTGCSTSHCGSSARQPLFRRSQTCPPRNIERKHARQLHLWPAHRSTRGLPCCLASASSADSSAADTEAARQLNEAPHNRLSREEIERRVRKAANLMIAGDELAPFDRRSFNPALVLWKAIAEIPPAERKSLLRYLLPRDIERVWRMSGEKYWAKRQDILAAMGPEWSIWDDLPSDPNEVIRYNGRAAVPLPGLVGGFSKVFFVQPDTFDLYGRVQVHKGPLGDLLYPLYFRCNIGPSSIPATGEVSDMQLEYLRPEQLQLQPGDLPKKGRWPHIRAPRWPFDADLVDHVRAVGPGVYVGVGWRSPRENKVELGRRFLPFMLVREYGKQLTMQGIASNLIG